MSRSWCRGEHRPYVRLAERIQAEHVDVLFVPPSSDLEYLTGVERAIPTFGQSQYAHGWVAGAFFAPEREPVFLLTPRRVGRRRTPDPSVRGRYSEVTRLSAAAAFVGERPVI